MTIADVGWSRRLSITGSLGNMHLLYLRLQNYLKEPFTNTSVLCYSCHNLTFDICCHFNALLAVILILLLLYSHLYYWCFSPLPPRFGKHWWSSSIGYRFPWFSAPLGGWYNNNVWNVCLPSDESLKLSHLTSLPKLFGSLLLIAWHRQAELVLWLTGIVELLSLVHCGIY